MKNRRYPLYHEPTPLHYTCITGFLYPKEMTVWEYDEPLAIRFQHVRLLHFNVCLN